jgi:hypothetical protein
MVADKNHDWTFQPDATDADRRRWAIHESGHAVVTIHLGLVLGDVEIGAGWSDPAGAMVPECSGGGGLPCATVGAAGVAATLRERSVAPSDWGGLRLLLRSDEGQLDYVRIQESLERVGIEVPEGTREAERRADEIMADPRRWRGVQALTDQLPSTESCPERGRHESFERRNVLAG